MTQLSTSPGRSSTTQASTIQPGFMVLQSNRLEDLRSVTLNWLAAHPLGPMEDEVVLVQSDGVAQWLRMAMAAGQDDASTPGWGIAFGIKTLLPARFQWQAYRALLEQAEPGSVPENTPFDRNRLRWLLFKQIPLLLKNPVYQPLQTYLRDDSQHRKQWQLVEKLADLFDQYQVYRADWLKAWSDGIDQLISAGGQSTPLEDDQHWQAQLWRDLQDSVPPEVGNSHRAAVHSRFMVAAENLSPSNLPASLPRRLVVFGISSLPQQTLEALAALSSGVQIMLCMVNPCRHYWGDLIEDRQLLRQEYLRQQHKTPGSSGRDEHDLTTQTHPLLAAWGKQGRDYLHLIDVHDQTNSYAHLFKDLGLQIDLFESPTTTTLLGQLQDDILDLRAPAQSREHWQNGINPAEDRSITMHVTHSPHRELEVLHDQLIDTFNRDSSLLPRDVIVMVPDINSIAASIDAVFSQFERGDELHIPYQTADRTQRNQSPLVIGLELLLNLPSLRLRASEIMQLLEIAALQQRFGMDDADISRLQQWITEANIRWGLNEQHRESLDLPGFDGMNTWQFGLQRMIYGYAMGELPTDQDAPDDVMPFDDVSGLGAAAVGQLVRLVECLDRFRNLLAVEHRVSDWIPLLQELLSTFFTASSSVDERLLDQLVLGLDTWQEECDAADFDEPLPLNIVRETWLQRIDEAQAGQRYGGGAVTFATMLPMRAIPFRHVCLIGLSDEQFPRKSSAPDFDLMAMRGQYRPGDRSRREDDRYLFLEAILAARDSLYLSWAGRSQRDNSELPCSVLVGQLQDQIKQVWRLDGAAQEEDSGEQLLAALTTTHPLQPFSQEYFVTHDDFSGSRLFTYSSDWARAASKTEATAGEPGLTTSHQLSPWVPATDLNLEQLKALMTNPVNALFQNRFNLRLAEVDEEASDDEHFNAGNGLDMWLKQDTLLNPVAQRLAMEPELDVPASMAHLQTQQLLSGEYPMGEYGRLTIGELSEPLVFALQELRHLIALYPVAIARAPGIELSVKLAAPTSNGQPTEIHLSGNLSNVRQSNEGHHARLVTETSKLHDDKGNAQLRNVAKHWPHHLALQVAVGGTASHIVSPRGTVVLKAMAPADARQHLQQLLAAFHHCMHDPVPLTADIAAAALACAKGDLAGLEGLDTGELQQLLETNKSFQTSVGQARSKGSAFARQFESTAAVVQNPLFLPLLAQIYLPLYQALYAPTEDEA